MLQFDLDGSDGVVMDLCWGSTSSSLAMECIARYIWKNKGALLCVDEYGEKQRLHRVLHGVFVHLDLSQDDEDDERLDDESEDGDHPSFLFHDSMCLVLYPQNAHI